MRLIDAEETKELLHEYCIDGDKNIQYYYDLMGIDETIDNAPTIDPIKHGRWEKVEALAPALMACSECGWVQDILAYGRHYCPNCGARMDGGSHEDD